MLIYFIFIKANEEYINNKHQTEKKMQNNQQQQK